MRHPDCPAPLSHSSNYVEFQCPQLPISPLSSTGRVKGEQEGWNVMHLHKTERDELQEMVLAPVLSDVCWDPLF